MRVLVLVFLCIFALQNGTVCKLKEREHPLISPTHPTPSHVTYEGPKWSPCRVGLGQVDEALRVLQTAKNWGDFCQIGGWGGWGVGVGGTAGVLWKYVTVTRQCNGLTVWLFFKDGIMPATCKMKGRHSGWVPHRHAISVPRIDVFCVFAAPVGLSVTGGCANLTFWLPPV